MNQTMSKSYLFLGVLYPLNKQNGEEIVRMDFFLGKIKKRHINLPTICDIRHMYNKS